MTLPQIILFIYAPYALFGLIGVILDLGDPKERKALESMSFLPFLALMVCYIFLLGVFSFYPAFVEYRYRKACFRRRSDVIFLLDSITGYQLNCMSKSERLFVISLNQSEKRGVITDAELIKLESIAGELGITKAESL